MSVKNSLVNVLVRAEFLTDRPPAPPLVITYPTALFMLLAEGPHSHSWEVKTVRKERGVKKHKKTQKIVTNVQISHAMEVNLKKKIITYRLVEVTKNKIKNNVNFLPTHWVKWQQIGNKHIFCFGPTCRSFSMLSDWRIKNLVQFQALQILNFWICMAV